MSFIKQVTATVVGILLACLILVIISIVTLAGVVASEGVSGHIEPESILRIDLSGTIADRTPEENPLDVLMGEESIVQGLDVLTEALKKAADDDNIQGLYLKGGNLSTEPATAEELRHALLRFKKSGKWIMAYGEDYSKSAYYLCSVADTVMINPLGTLQWNGLSSQILFYKETMEKLGVRMQVFKVGTFKSAVEPFTSTEMSEANRLQQTSYMNSIWNVWLTDVAKSRGMSPEYLNTIANELPPVPDAQRLKAFGLIDAICYIDQADEIVRKKAGKTADDKLYFVSPSAMVSAESLGEKHEDEIAVYYASGDIVDTPSDIYKNEPEIVGSKVVNDLKQLREDKNVKAVVLRVNSGGGSAYASEQMWREIQLLGKEKPVIVSMGGLAASGGYYMSCGAHKIFAEKTTITGSIGIFGMIPDASELMNDKLGLHFDGVKTNDLADFGASGRPLNEKECAVMQAYIERGYDLFTNRVAMGRSMSQDSVKAIAEGRVWTGEQALAIGLVDKIGDLNAAVKEAAKRAGTKDYAITTYPAPTPWYTRLTHETQSSYINTRMQEVLGINCKIVKRLHAIMNQHPMQARMPYELDIR